MRFDRRTHLRVQLSQSVVHLAIERLVSVCVRFRPIDESLARADGNRHVLKSSTCLNNPKLVLIMPARVAAPVNAVASESIQNINKRISQPTMLIVEIQRSSVKIKRDQLDVRSISHEEFPNLPM